MNLKKYLSFTRAGIIEEMQFRASFIIMVVGNLLYLIKLMTDIDNCFSFSGKFPDHLKQDLYLIIRQ